MGMVVRSNIMALNAQRQLGMNNSQVSKSLEKLSSGFKINRAGDDASGLAISEKMKAQIKGLETASANSQDGISLIQTAEGALTEVHDMLNRMVELAEKSANGTMENPVDENGNPIEGAYGNAGTDRNAIQDEMDALATEIDRIAKSTNFNGIKLLDGSLGGISVKKTVGKPKEVVAPSQVDIDDVKLGGNGKPASFTIKPKYQAGTKMSIGGKYFQFSGAYEAAALEGSGTEKDPYKINLESYKDSDGKLDTKGIAATIAETVNNAGGAKIGNKTFMAKADANGNITMVAATQDGKGVWTEDTTPISKTEDAFKKEIGESIKVEQVKDEEVFEGTTQVTVIPGIPTAGVTANPGKEETQTIKFEGEFKAGNTITINKKQYTFVDTLSDKPEEAANQILVGANTGAGVKANTLQNIADKIIGDKTVWQEVGAGKSAIDADNNSIILKSVNKADVAPLEISYKQDGAVKIAGTDPVEGVNKKAGSETTSVFNFGSDAFAAGDTVKIGENTYKFIASTETDKTTGTKEDGVILVKPEESDAIAKQLEALAAQVIAKETGGKGEAIWTSKVETGTLTFTATTKSPQAQLGNATVVRHDTVTKKLAEDGSGSVEGNDGTAEKQVFDLAAYTDTKAFKVGDSITVSSEDKNATPVVFEFVSGNEATATIEGAIAINIASDDTLDGQLNAIVTKLKEKNGLAGWADKNTTKAENGQITLETDTTGTQHDLTFSITRAAATVTVSSDVGKTPVNEVKASATYNFAEIVGEGKSFANGDVVTIGATDGKTYTFTTDAQKESETGHILIQENESLASALEKLKAKINADAELELNAGAFTADVNADGNLVLTSKKEGTNGDADFTDSTVTYKSSKEISAKITEDNGAAVVTGVQGSYEITLNDLDKMKNGDKLTIGSKTFVIQTDPNKAPAVSQDPTAGEVLVDLSNVGKDASSLKDAVLKAAGQELNTDGTVKTPADFGEDYDATLTADAVTGKLTIKVEVKEANADKYSDYTDTKLQQGVGYAAIGTSTGAATANQGIALADAGDGIPATPGVAPATDGDETTPSVTNKVFETTITKGTGPNALAAGDKINVGFVGADGKEYSISLTVDDNDTFGTITVANAGNPEKIAEKLAAIIKESNNTTIAGLTNADKFKAAFKTVTADASGKFTFTGADDAESVSLTGISFTASGGTSPKAEWSGGTVKDVTPQTEEPSTEDTSKAGKAEVTFKTNPKEGMTVTFGKGENAVTFEFVKNQTDKPKTKNALAVALGSDVSETLDNLKAAVDGATDAETETALFGKDGLLKLDVTFTDNGFTVTNLDKKDPSEAPEVSTKGGGLTLQIGDTYEDFNLMNVAVNHMNMDSLFGDTDAYESMIKLDDGTMSLNVSTQEEAGKSLNAIKTAINTVSTQRAKLGALQNRLEHTINNLDVAAENMNAANSRIRDTDMAKQMMEYTKMNVLTQAAQAMLAQANQQPQSVLQLLQ